MKEINLVFVILHYISIEETIQSVASIQKYMDSTCYGIVIVDNASPNESIHTLRAEYESQQDKIHIVYSQENVGYARGLNIGIAKAKKIYEFEFMILMNNDIYFIEEHFYEKVQSEYRRSHFAVLGPMILCGDGTCNGNPHRKISLTIRKFKLDYPSIRNKNGY